MPAAAVVINVGLNYLLIFGHGGLPAMGLLGATVATCLARVVELLILLLASYWQRHLEG